ncbi:hypothetical protein THASP1DRAFT_22755 [Thamnocephalis sphaerospora]|uniref:P-loop containing nucleoside triphosphate hydrolase protein n=1 Tax=Thamnocephalis sphaerospora TaxID=78915 RepID=A0A4P9XTB6_9FUNG|nr:hypothetical protein THASP1DRAFT_22755 [Thamnocephalis sphaerospora]|eukprot:RKP09405.1 hypothetical protein THASP1DRAFT_22755 [Thamnocephalis sphaerospora]
MGTPNAHKVHHTHSAPKWDQLRHRSLTSRILPGRVIVVGSTGAGKTRLAAELSQLLAQPHIDLSAIYCSDDGHCDSATEDTALQVKLILDAHSDGWVTNGDFYAWRPPMWSRADTLVWLDYPLWRVVLRLLGQSVGLSRCDGFGGAENAHGRKSRSTTRRSWFSGLSSIRHAIRLHRQITREYPSIIGACPRLRVCRFRSPHEAAQWVAQLDRIDQQLDAYYSLS